MSSLIYKFGAVISKDVPIYKGFSSIFGFSLSQSLKLCAFLGYKKKLKLSDLSKSQWDELTFLIHNNSLNFNYTKNLINLLNKDIQRLVLSKTYRGIRHKKGLSVRGQRTHSNSYTQRNIGKRRVNNAFKRTFSTNSSISFNLIKKDKKKFNILQLDPSSALLLKKRNKINLKGYINKSLKKKNKFVPFILKKRRYKLKTYFTYVQRNRKFMNELKFLFFMYRRILLLLLLHNRVHLNFKKFYFRKFKYNFYSKKGIHNKNNRKIFKKFIRNIKFNNKKKKNQNYALAKYVYKGINLSFSHLPKKLFLLNKFSIKNKAFNNNKIIKKKNIKGYLSLVIFIKSTNIIFYGYDLKSNMKFCMSGGLLGFKGKFRGKFHTLMDLTSDLIKYLKIKKIKTIDIFFKGLKFRGYRKYLLRNLLRVRPFLNLRFIQDISSIPYNGTRVKKIKRK